MSAAAGDLERKKLVLLMEDREAPAAPVYALTPPGRYITAQVRALVDPLAGSLASRLESREAQIPRGTSF